MKHSILCLMGAGLLMITTWSCREESDTLMSYDHNESLMFEAADTSFAAKFQVMWNGMNQYYGIWDYEAEQGMDWDAVYDEYYPQFAALDQRGKNEMVTDDELKLLMEKVLKPLHDGHFYMSMKNHKTGSTVTYNPASEKIATRDDWKIAQSFSPNLSYYVANGEMETDNTGAPIIMEHSTLLAEIVTKAYMTPGIGYQWIKAKVSELEAKASPSEMEAFQLKELKELMNELTILGSTNFDINKYNNLQSKYGFLNVPGFDYIDPIWNSKGISLKYALLKGNIAYFRINKFALSYYFDDKMAKKTFDMSNPSTKNHVEQIKQLWQAWFDAVQQLHKNGQLGGVIIDVRSNGGGAVPDFKYCVGALLPEGGYQLGYQRAKRGYGRYDYSPLIPAMACTMSGPHEIIDDKPVVLLTNSMTISMAEMSTLGVKLMTNGTVIGKRTWGANCPLSDNEDYSINYSGRIGIEGVTPVFGNVPTFTSFTFDHKLIESVGIAPDIEVSLDETLFKTTGQDTQLDRALQFIRTGK